MALTVQMIAQYMVSSSSSNNSISKGEEFCSAGLQMSHNMFFHNHAHTHLPRRLDILPFMLLHPI